MTPTQRDIVRFRVLQAIENNPEASQRELARDLGVSLGSINFCIKAFVDKGLIKVDSFLKSDNKRGYAYYLTPQGVVEKGEITVEFLNRKKEEYELLKQEIAELSKEVEKQSN
ncbi:MAG: MarR family EPS-associated transcriptional regulator [Alteromonadaceae bacterium]|nr:MarR family EPS-associated transcriptional regulator [Alteromonadaceae bacterium]